MKMKMKTKFKYLTLLASAFLIGFSSCSNDDETGTGGKPVEGQKTIAKINLTQVNRATTYASTGTEAPSLDEKKVNSAILYVFSSTKVLEAEVPLNLTGTPTTGAEKIFELTTGTKYFYAAVNVPSSKKPTIAIGTSMDDAIKSILTVSNVTDLYPANSFFMTNVDTPAAVYIDQAQESDVIAGTKNNITIPVGRAMIKASLDYTKANVTQPANGELDNVKFLLANNPTKMYYMAYVTNAGQLETPYFNNSTIASGYYPDLTTISSSDFLAADGSATTYGMENSNKVVLAGNATYALIQGKFTPKKVVDKDGGNETAGTSGADFWRIQLTDGSFTDKFYNEIPTGGSDMAANPGATAVKYTGGVCYYAFYLADNSVSGNSTVKYTVKRNSFWKMKITDVSGVGSNSPEEVVPDPSLPIEAKTFIKGQIDILDWAVYDQSGGI